MSGRAWRRPAQGRRRGLHREAGLLDILNGGRGRPRSPGSGDPGDPRSPRGWERSTDSAPPPYARRREDSPRTACGPAAVREEMDTLRAEGLVVHHEQHEGGRTVLNVGRPGGGEAVVICEAEFPEAPPAVFLLCDGVEVEHSLAWGAGSSLGPALSKLLAVRPHDDLSADAVQDGGWSGGEAGEGSPEAAAVDDLSTSPLTASPEAVDEAKRGRLQRIARNLWKKVRCLAWPASRITCHAARLEGREDDPPWPRCESARRR